MLAPLADACTCQDVSLNRTQVVNHPEVFVPVMEKASEGLQVEVLFNHKEKSGQRARAYKKGARWCIREDAMELELKALEDGEELFCVFCCERQQQKAGIAGSWHHDILSVCFKSSADSGP